MTIKLVVIYLRPSNIEAFETVHNRVHVPMAVGRLGGKPRLSRPGSSVLRRANLRSTGFKWRAIQNCAPSCGRRSYGGQQRGH
jgi:hypothetical protein